MSKKLYEYKALLECSVIVAADNENAAREEVKTYEKAWIETGDFVEATSITLLSVLNPGTEDEDVLNDLAHVVI